MNTLHDLHPKKQYILYITFPAFVKISLQNTVNKSSNEYCMYCTYIYKSVFVNMSLHKLSRREDPKSSNVMCKSGIQWKIGFKNSILSLCHVSTGTRTIWPQRSGPWPFLVCPIALLSWNLHRLQNLEKKVYFVVLFNSAAFFCFNWACPKSAKIFGGHPSHL